MLEIASKENNSVSFSELARLFNQYFNIREDDEKQFIPFYLEKLTNHIVKIAIMKRSIGFSLESHFQLPGCSYSQFMLDLKKEPLNCMKEFTQQIIDELASRYQQGGYINT